jgi:hypothetical protein
LLNAEHQPTIRAGLAWLERQATTRFSREFLSLSEAEHAAILQPLSDAIDRLQRDQQRGRFRVEGQGKAVYYVGVTDRDQPARPAAATPAALDADPAAPVGFFRLIKSLTADGYYTSRIGLIEELGYAGNTALGRFPVCPVPEQ